MMPSQLRTAITRAADLLTAACEAEARQSVFRGDTIAAMGLAEGTLRAMLGYLPDESSQPPLPLDTVRVRASDLDWDGLAELARARRNWLGMSQFDVTRAGGPSEQTLRRIENGQRCTYEQRTLSRLEKVLRWRPNTVNAILKRDVEDRGALIGENRQPAGPQ